MDVRSRFLLLIAVVVAFLVSLVVVVPLDFGDDEDTSLQRVFSNATMSRSEESLWNPLQWTLRLPWHHEGNGTTIKLGWKGRPFKAPQNVEGNGTTVKRHGWMGRWKQVSMKLNSMITQSTPSQRRRKLQEQEQEKLLDESPLSRLIWNSREARTDHGYSEEGSQAQSGQRRRRRRKHTQVVPGVWFRTEGENEAEEAEAGLSEQGMESIRQASDDHAEDIGDAAADSRDAGEGANADSQGAEGQDGSSIAFKHREKGGQFMHHVHDRAGVVGEPDSPHVYSSRQQEHSVKDLADFPSLDISLPIVRKYAVLVDSYLTPWMGIPGVESGMGAKGMISDKLLESMGRRQFVMNCAGHVRIIDGQIYFRYGRFRFTWYRMLRFLVTMKLLEDTLAMYKLYNLRAEFFLNTCDLPMSFDSSMGRERGGYPLFSTEWVKGSIDILYPDPLDLSEQYFSSQNGQVPWAKKVPVAFFRGATTNYILRNDSNWRASPRLRLHRMSEVRPDLVDAQVTRWSHADEKGTRANIEKDGVRLGKHTSSDVAAMYKYSIVVDGGGGSCRTCAALLADQVMIRQTSSFQQFYQPLLLPFTHFIPTQHYFGNLYQRIEWARSHDSECRQMVLAANELARWACTWKGRALYWAILLIKYSKNALEDASLVQPPQQETLCQHIAVVSMMVPGGKGIESNAPPEGWPPACGSPDAAAVQQPECMRYCDGDDLPNDKFWITGAVNNIPRIPLEPLIQVKE